MSEQDADIKHYQTDVADKKALKKVKITALGTVECPTCGGSGKVAGITCGDCDGAMIITLRQAYQQREQPKPIKNNKKNN